MTIDYELALERAGNFTASENHRLMAGWDTPEADRDFEGFESMYPVMKLDYDDGCRKFLVRDYKDLVTVKVSTEMISKTLAVIKGEAPPTGLVSYAQEKAVEEISEPDPSLYFETAHTENGNARELDAVAIFQQKTGITLHHTGENQIHIQSDGVGCTPDGVIIGAADMVDGGCEIKCKSPKHHAALLEVTDNESLKAAAFDHYVQIQTSIFVTGSDSWYFAIYNPYFKDDRDKFRLSVINRDFAVINVLKKRIEIAKQIKADYLEKLISSRDCTQQAIGA